MCFPLHQKSVINGPLDTPSAQLNPAAAKLSERKSMLLSSCATIISTATVLVLLLRSHFLRQLCVFRFQYSGTRQRESATKRIMAGDLLNVDYNNSCQQVFQSAWKRRDGLRSGSSPGTGDRHHLPGASTYGGETSQTWRRFPVLRNLCGIGIETEVVVAAG